MKSWLRRYLGIEPVSTEHRHDFVIINAQPVMYTIDAICTERQTVILHRCKGCGEHQTSILLGFWTLADLLRSEWDAAALEVMISK